MVMRDPTGNLGTWSDEVRGRTGPRVFKSMKLTGAPDVARYHSHTLAAV